MTDVTRSTSLSGAPYCPQCRVAVARAKYTNGTIWPDARYHPIPKHLFRPICNQQLTKVVVLNSARNIQLGSDPICIILYHSAASMKKRSSGAIISDWIISLFRSRARTSSRDSRCTSSSSVASRCWSDTFSTPVATKQ